MTNVYKNGDLYLNPSYFVTGCTAQQKYKGMTDMKIQLSISFRNGVWGSKSLTLLK